MSSGQLYNEFTARIHIYIYAVILHLRNSPHAARCKTSSRPDCCESSAVGCCSCPCADGAVVSSTRSGRLEEGDGEGQTGEGRLREGYENALAANEKGENEDQERRQQKYLPGRL